MPREPAGAGADGRRVLGCLLGCLGEHLAARGGWEAPSWCWSRRLCRFWLPFNTRAARVDAIVTAPDVYVSAARR